MRRSTRAVLVLVLLAFAPTARAAEISVTQWGASLYGLPYAVAMQQGLFKRAGIDITGIIGSGGGGTTVRNILASDLPYGEVAVAAALAAKQQGLDIVIVNTGTRSVADASIVTMPDSTIHSLHDLVGHKMALTSPRAVSEMLFLLALKAEGIDAAQVTRVYAGGYGPALTLLEHGGADASALIEPLSIIDRAKYRTVVAYKDVLQPMTTSVGITTRAFASAHPDTIRAIIAGRRAGVDAIYADPAAAAVIAEGPFHLSPEIAKIAVDNMIGPRMWSEGDLNQTELDRIADGLRLIGEVHGEVDWPAVLDRSFLPPDLAAKR